MRWSVVILILSGCAMARPQAPAPCPLAGQKPMTQIELFFGRDIAGRAQVSDAEWEAFSNTVLSKEFPEGSTTLMGRGQWLDPQAQQTIHEPSILVLVDVEPGSHFEDKVTRVVEAYKKQFEQQSVGVVTYEVCARF